MVLETKNLGTVEYTQEEIITFEKGILAFEDEKEYLVLRNQETEFYYLQSISNPENTFIIVDLKDVMPSYDPEVDVDQLADLGNIDNNLCVFNMCTLKDSLEEMTVNLLGPVVINMDTKKGKQVVVAKDNGYTVKHKLFK